MRILDMPNNTMHHSGCIWHRWFPVYWGPLGASTQASMSHFPLQLSTKSFCPFPPEFILSAQFLLSPVLRLLDSGQYRQLTSPPPLPSASSPPTESPAYSSPNQPSPTPSPTMSSSTISATATPRASLSNSPPPPRVSPLHARFRTLVRGKEAILNSLGARIRRLETVRKYRMRTMEQPFLRWYGTHEHYQRSGVERQIRILSGFEAFEDSGDEVEDDDDDDEERGSCVYDDKESGREREDVDDEEWEEDGMVIIDRRRAAREPKAKDEREEWLMSGGNGKSPERVTSQKAGVRFEDDDEDADQNDEAEKEPAQSLRRTKSEKTRALRFEDGIGPKGEAVELATREEERLKKDSVTEALQGKGGESEAEVSVLNRGRPNGTARRKRAFSDGAEMVLR
ncbi:hypothetical protein BDV96DRAFT_660281 [Lophiotrema nucula]|uniref:Uncharacterized protein n=1 Tax=Lophiotrema nucula TaxID=690887 RepID=A0A6A5Z606_9PLEO|nr:hypothetical protein BDV96DRAFT_660281 [Lophiotrema nucula]